MKDVKIMALGFSYNDEIDENYSDSDYADLNDFESVDDDVLNKFDDDFDESDDYDDSDESSADSDDVSAENGYDDEFSEDTYPVNLSSETESEE